MGATSSQGCERRSLAGASGGERKARMNPEEMTVEQHLTVLYLLDIAEGEGVTAVDVDGFSDLPEGAVLLQLTQIPTSGQHSKLTYEIARDGSHRRHSPQENGFLASTPQKVWRGQDVESFRGVWFPFRPPSDQEWIELRQELGRDPLDPMMALEPILDAVAPDEELETESGEPPLDAEPPAPESSSE